MPADPNQWGLVQIRERGGRKTPKSVPAARPNVGGSNAEETLRARDGTKPGATLAVTPGQQPHSGQLSGHLRSPGASSS